MGKRTKGEYNLHDRDKKGDALKEEKARMLTSLERMHQKGVELFMDGQEVLPAEAVSRTVRENSPYMADYVLDDAGAVRQVRFDKVTRR